MSPFIRIKKFNSYLVLSAIVHCSILLLPAALPNFFNVKPRKQNMTPLKIHSLRTVGENNSKILKNVFLKKKKKLGQQKQKISAKQLAPQFAKEQSKRKALDEKPIRLSKRTGAIKELSLNKKSINSFLKNTPQAINSRQFLNALGETSSVVKLEVPKGVKEDELNKHELVFYSFQKRTALNYINSFYKKLNEFEMQNPHLKFPLTENKQKMVGRVVYDKDGNIIKINILKWTTIPKLQSFFVDVLKEMTSLPNPPQQILKDDQFTVFYALTIND